MTYKDGSVYEGQFYSGKPSKGKMTYPNGDVFIGELRDDKPYKGKMTYKDGTIPEGVVKDGNIYKIEYKNGKPFQGEITYLNGNKYIGYFDENGKPNNGKMILPNGNIYKSNFIGNFIDDNGNPNYNCGGEFTVTYADYGDVYEGYCGPDGKPSDSEEEGRLRYKNGDEFYGEFKKGEPYEGSLTYRDRSCFDGIFKDGEPYNGKIEDNKGKTVWKGTWESGYTRDGKKIDVGIFEGEYRDNKPYEGKVTYSNGDFFEGKCRYGRAYEGVMTSKDKDNNIHENKLEGGKLSREGKIKYANGNIFEGSFNDEGKPSYGKMTYHNGNVYKGDFNYNGEPKCHRGDKLILPNGDTYTSRKDDDTFTINDRGEPCDGEYSISYGDYTSFRGKVVNGKPSHGKLDKKDGTTFIGDFVNGKPSSTGKMEYSVNNKNGFKEFEGSFVNDIPSHGKMTYWEHCLDDVLNGNIFEGDFVNGKPYNGTMIYEDGAPFGNAGYTFDDFNDVYVICQNGASFKGIVDENGKRSKGKMTYVDGTSFDGEFKDNIPYKGIRVIGNTIFDGTFKKVKENDYCYQIRSLEDRDKGYEGGERFQGTLTYGDKSVYEGSFENDKPSFGKITYPNGNIFEGTCRDYEPYKGKMTYTNGNVYEGNFHDGEISDGIMTCRDGTIFESGEISDGGDPIEGKMLYTNGDAFRGKFKNGKPSIGVKVLNNGDMLDGFWEDDRPVDVAVKVKLSDDGKSYCSFEAGEKSSYQKNVVEYHLGDRAEVTINYDGFNRILNGDAPEINSLNDLVSRKIISGVKDFNELKELSKKVFQDKMSRGTEDVHRGNHGSLSNLLLLSSIDTVDQFKGAKFIEPMQDNREVKAVSLTVDEMKAKIEALEIPRSKRLPEPKPGRYPGFFMGPVARKEQKSDLHRKIQAARKNKDETFASREEKRKNEKKDISGVGHK
jgi:hypothetical protein